MAVVNGTKGNDTIFVDGGNDVVKAGNGNDYIYAGAGNDVITGGSGVNTIDFNTIKLPFEESAKPMGHDIVNLTKGETLTLDCTSKTAFEADIVGKDVVVSFGEKESITLKNFASKDVVGSNGSVNLLVSNPNYDELDATKGPKFFTVDLKDYLFAGGAFNKKGAYSGSWLSEDIDASYLNSQEVGFGKKGINGVNVKGNNGDDSITGSKFNDTLYGGNHNDTVNGGAGNDVITGGKGENTVIHHADDGNDIINLTKGEDLLLKVDSFDHAEIAANKKDVLIYTSQNEYITIKNLAAKDVTNDATKKKEDKSSVMLQSGTNAAFELRDYLYKTTVDKNYTGTWLNENIDASGIETAFDKKGVKGVSVKAGNGEDTITGSSFNDTLYGGNDADEIVGAEGVDKIYGDKGDDYLVGGLGKDSIYGGDGDDEITAGVDTDDDTWGTDTDGNYVDAGKGDDYVYGSDKNDTLKAGDGNDFVWTMGGNDTVYGGNGHDALVAEAGGSSTLYGEKGNDLIEIKYDGDVAYGGDGDDELHVGYKDIDTSVYGTEIDATIYGGKGNDVISIFTGGATVNGEAGNDVIWGSRTAASNIVFAAGGGNDVYKYMGQADVLVFDKINASSLSFETVTSSRADKYYSYDEEDRWYENPVKEHTDLVITYGKNQSVKIEDYNPETMDNIYVETKDGGKVLLSDMIKSYYGTTKSNKITTDKEIVHALAGNDKVTLTSNGSTVYAGDGKDTVFGSAGEDYILGENGNDSLLGGAAYDVIDGGEGNDFIDGQEGQSYLMGGAGNDTINGGSEYDCVEGGEGADVIDGKAGDDYLLGGTGGDTIYGGEGNDYIMSSDYDTVAPTGEYFKDYYGGYYSKDEAGNLLDGGAGDDWIYGNLGADTIYAGAGDDGIELYGENSVAHGGEGNDQFNVYRDTEKTVYGDAGDDTVSVEFGKATVTGGTGDDALWGGYISDSTFIFAAGDGNDKYQYRGYLKSPGGAGPTFCNDTLVFENISSNDMTFAQDGENLVITYADNSSVALEYFFKDGSNSANWNVYIKTTEGTALLSDMVGLQNLLLKLATPEGAIAGTIGNDEFTAEKESAVVYGYNGDDTFTVSNDWAARGDEAGKTTTVTFDGGVGNDTFKFGYGTYDANVSGGAGADVFDFTGSWPHDVWMEEEKQIATGANITISDINADDKVIFSQYTANHMAGEGVYVNDSADGYAKYSMIFDVTLDKEGNATADLSKITFSLKDAGTIADKWNDELGMPNTSFVLQTEDGSSLVDTAKIFVRDAEGNDVEYKFNETVINQITEKVASWLSTETEYGSVMEAIADGNKDVLAQFVNAVKPYDQGFGTESYVGEDILVPVV